MSITEKDISFIESSNDIRVVIVNFVTNRGPVDEDQISDWLRMEYNPDHIPYMLDYWLPELESHGEIVETNGLWSAGTISGELGRPRGWTKDPFVSESIRRIVRQLIIENVGTTGYKMIFLAGLPGGGKSTLLKQLAIEDKFTNCNIDNFFEPSLMPELGTMNLEIPARKKRALEKKQKEHLQNGTEMDPEELQELLDLQDFSDREQALFRRAINSFNAQVKEVCEIGSNFIIDGTAANSGPTLRKAKKYQDMGYDCAMIFVNIDWKTSQARNTARGAKGGRAIDGRIIWRQGQGMDANIPVYEEFFGKNFFLVNNKGTFDEYKKNIEMIRPGVQAFMES